MSYLMQKNNFMLQLIYEISRLYLFASIWECPEVFNQTQLKWLNKFFVFKSI